MLDADKSHLDVTWVSQSLYSGPLSNPDFFLSLIAGRIRQVVLYNKGADQYVHSPNLISAFDTISSLPTYNEPCGEKTCLGFQPG